jgi:hypothetical protein
LLASAASHRGMMPGELVSELVEGVFRRGNASIDRLLRGRSFPVEKTSGVPD